MSEAASNALGSANLCLTHSALAAGTTTSVTTAALTICIQGRSYAVSAASNGAAGTTDFVTGKAFLPINKGGVGLFVVGYDKAGTRRVIQGPVGDNSGYINGESTPDFPEVPAEVAVVGYIMIQGGPTTAADWVFGVNNMSGVTGITYTFVPCTFLPASPPSA